LSSVRKLPRHPLSVPGTSARRSPDPGPGRPCPCAAGRARATAGFEDSATGPPVAITTDMLRPGMFRIVIDSTAGTARRTDGLTSVWTREVQGWEP